MNDLLGAAIRREVRAQLEAAMAPREVVVTWRRVQTRDRTPGARRRWITWSVLATLEIPR